jgi:CO/xanthine dehydrogenase FAD-binding subunit
MSPEYIPAKSLEEALDTLDRQGGRTRILAGGTDVMVALRTARLESSTIPEFLLDISFLPELKKIHFEDDRVIIGAAVPFRVLESHPQIQKRWPLLARASSRIGSPQVRHLATLGGNVGTASPAGDGITPLVALSAVAHIHSARGSRYVPVGDLISSPGKNALTLDELIVSFSVRPPLQPEAFFFDKIMRRQAVAIARMNLAVQLALNPSGEIASAAIAAGAISPRPGRLTEVEKQLIGQIPDDELFLNAGETATRVMLEASGRRPSMAYKVPALKKLVALGIKTAYRSGLRI